MFLKLIKKLNHHSTILTRRQTSIFSAATIIMFMIVAARILGLVRNRVLAHFFDAETLSVYFAAFRLPDIILEVLIFGTLSSAFIPVFTTYISKRNLRQAWHVASICLNFALIFFLILALIIFLLARPIYGLIAPGYSAAELDQIVRLARILLLVQGFFVVSYFITAVLESLRRFVASALAPLFYNLGIILGTIIFAPSLGIYAPVMGAVLGASMHLLVQLPVAISLGFSWRRQFNFRDPGVRKVTKLAAPRILELSLVQLSKSAELFLASLISTAAFTYFTFANSLQLLPIGLFGISMAKASLPTMAIQSAQGKKEELAKTFTSLFGQMLFLILPFSFFLAILRIPVIRLVFGASQFDWLATVQTGYALTAFCLGLSAQALVYLINRTFYALQDTWTPVKISILTVFVNVTLGGIFVLGFQLPVWSLALAFSLASIFQFSLLLFLLTKHLPELSRSRLISKFVRLFLLSSSSGGLMFFLLKIMDRSVWSKQLSFLRYVGLRIPIDFVHFVLDTRYTFNLILLTIFVGAVGLIFYLFLSYLFKVEELALLSKLLIRMKKLELIKPKIPQDKESLTFSQEETG